MNIEQQIEQCIESFDWTAMKCIIDAMDYRWIDIDNGNFYSPSIATLKSTARKLLLQSAKTKKTLRSHQLIVSASPRVAIMYVPIVRYIDQKTMAQVSVS